MRPTYFVAITIRRMGATKPPPPKKNNPRRAPAFIQESCALPVTCYAFRLSFSISCASKSPHTDKTPKDPSHSVRGAVGASISVRRGRLGNDFHLVGVDEVAKASRTEVGLASPRRVVVTHQFEYNAKRIGRRTKRGRNAGRNVHFDIFSKSAIQRDG